MKKAIIIMQPSKYLKWWKLFCLRSAPFVLIDIQITLYVCVFLLLFLCDAWGYGSNKLHVAV